MSDAPPRRRLVAPPVAVPIRRRLGLSGIVSAAACGTSGLEAAEDPELALARRLGPSDRCEYRALERSERAVAADGAMLGDEARREHDAVADHRQEQQLDILRRDVVAAV